MTLLVENLTQAFAEEASVPCSVCESLSRGIRSFAVG
jgi:hypothetical protein